MKCLKIISISKMFLELYHVSLILPNIVLCKQFCSFFRCFPKRTWESCMWVAFSQSINHSEIQFHFIQIKDIYFFLAVLCKYLFLEALQRHSINGSQ